MKLGVGQVIRALGGGAAAIILIPGLAMGQAALPGAANPNLLERQFLPPEPPKSSGGEIVTPEHEGAEAPPGAETAIFTLKAVHVEGSTVFQEADFAPLYDKLLGTTVSVKALYDLAQAITTKYTSAGYILSQAVVPPQKINGDGIVHIKVVEGYIDQVSIQGDVKGSRSLLEHYGEQIRASHPLRLDVLERYLLLASDLPGVTAHGVLKPGQVPGASDLVFQVSHKDVDAQASLDNRGSRYVGPWQSVVSANLNSPLGLYERTGFLYAATPFQPEKLKYGRVSHEEMIGGEGGKISADLGYSESHPGYSLKDAAIRSNSLLAGISGSYPVIRSRSENLNLQSRFDLRQADTDEYVNDLISKDRIRALRLGGNYDWVDVWGPAPAVTQLAFELSHGLDILGARQTGAAGLSVSDGHSDFLKLTFDASRTQTLTDQLSLFLALSGQVAGSSLLSSEQFTFGGSQFGRGYDPAEVTGDDGIAAKLEVRYSGPAVDWLKAWQAYGFWDGGRVWLINTGASAQPIRDGVSVGLGLRSDLNDWASINGELARPLTHGVAAEGGDGKDLRAFVGLMVKY